MPYLSRLQPYPYRRRTRWLLVLAGVVLALSATPASAVPTVPPPDEEAELWCERPNPPPICRENSPVGSLTSVSRPPSGLEVRGTATDPDASGPVSIEVQVDGRSLGTLLASGPGGAFSGTVVPQRPEEGRRVCVTAINRNQGLNTELGCRSLQVQFNPIGHLDQVSITAGGLRVRGWVIDPDTTAPVGVHLYVDGRMRHAVAASADRPDVGAIHPQYGAAHGFDAILPGAKRHTSVCAYGINVGPGSINSQLGCDRDPHAVSLFNLNIEGTHVDYPNDNGVGETKIPWRDRYRRVATWMADTGTLPDIITLQEVPARKQWNWPLPHNDPADYESLFVLIEEIKRRTNANYRIAYLSADYVDEGIQPLYQGRALIYNADRVRNTTLLVNSWPRPHDDTTTTGVHMRPSWPCDHPPAEFAHSCDLIDFEGRHWVSAHTNPSDNKWKRGPQAAMFELISDPGKHIIVVNAHIHPSTDPADYPSIQTLVDETTRLWAPRTMLMPPIVAGDLNGASELPDFDLTATENVDYIMTGKPSVFRSRYGPKAEIEVYPTRRTLPGKTEPEGFCGMQATYLSDHCALFAQYLPES
jgi:hypothetical protein